MRPISVEKPRFQQNRAVMMLDDAAMAMELIDLAQTTELKDNSGQAPSVPLAASDFLSELCSAASMIMDREECEAMAQEIEMARQAHPVAA